MKVLITAGDVVGLSATAAGEAIARGWLDTVPGAQVAVVALAEAGAEFVQTVADLDAGEVGLVDVSRPAGSPPVEPEDVVCLGVNSATVCAVSVEGIRADRSLHERAELSSSAWGQALATLLADRRHPPQTILIDASGNPGLDGGRGFLAALGATNLQTSAENGGVDLTAVRELIGGAHVVGIAGRGDEGKALLGLRGVISMAASAERDKGENPDPGRLLALDSGLATWAEALGVPTPAAGAGAGGGLGLAIQALGGEIMTGPQWLARANGLEETVRQADLIVTSTSLYDFASRGGGVVQAAADWATAAMRPCIVLAGEVVIGGREQRTMGVESAYPVHANTVVGAVQPVSGEQLRALAGRVAQTWSW